MTEPPTYPLWREGNRWICDGPNGRFHARTKAEAIRLLRETGGLYDDKVAEESQRRNLRASRGQP